MSTNSTIEWTEATWNPVTGCTKVSLGCKNCYAERMANRLQAMGQSNYRNGFEVTLQPQMLDAPLRWRKPRRIFVNSMSDLFHDAVPVDYIRRTFETMRSAHWHEFQILTKRAARLAEISRQLDWPANVWMGVSVEDQRQASRVDSLRACGARIKFLSLEPLLGPLSTLDLRRIDWVIVGGESGPHARPMEQRWVIDIKRHCDEQHVAFFFKQWGGTNKKQTGRLLLGKTWDAFPESRLP